MLHSKILETRGRPKKQETRTLAPIYKAKFSDNSAIIHACSLIYVFQVFISTKNQKRVGHKDGGFTIYDKIDHTYCFDNLQKVLAEWGMSYLLDLPQIKELVRLLPAIGPKLILREIIKLIHFIIKSKENGLQQREIVHKMCSYSAEEQIDNEYPYMRFVPAALRQLKLDKGQKIDSNINFNGLVRQRVKTLWKPLMKIIVHTILNSFEAKVQNKYFKPFFSDAENPYDTYIGQLNIEQIVSFVESQQDGKYLKQAENQSPKQTYEGFRKFRQIQGPDNQRSLLSIIKPPQDEDIGFKKPTIIRPIISVPSKKETPIKSEVSLSQSQILHESTKRPLLLISQKSENNGRQEKQQIIKDEVLQEEIDDNEQEDIM